jgi:16S rRNA (cytidine1402-2'-O)-methyltransferase
MPFYLLPNVFSDEQSPKGLLPEGLESIIRALHGLIVESERSGRRFVFKMDPDKEHARSLPLYQLNEHTSHKEIVDLVDRIRLGGNFGLVSDAGLPCLADPGSELISLLRKAGYDQIIAIPGPSSIILALLLSGFNAQQYTFHGYPPKEQSERLRLLRSLEGGPVRTHIFIETPYRNQSFLQDCLSVLSGSVELAVASALTLPQQMIQIRAVKQWKTQVMPLPKDPAIFLISTGSFKKS